MAELFSVDNIPKREPILDNESGPLFKPEEMDKQWNLLTEATRRELIDNAELREALIPFTASPVSEALPLEFVHSLLGNERLLKMFERFADDIGSYLSLDPVEEEQIPLDLRQAKKLFTPEQTKEMYERRQSWADEDLSEEFRQEIEADIKSGVYFEGITREERLMIIQRYRFARDVKLLALQSELLAHKNEPLIENEKSDSLSLPSGITITLNNNEPEATKELLDPRQWENRKQIKDRVYQVQIDASHYILKERKTPRHKDTRKGGHVWGLTAQEELEVAKHMKEHGSKDLDNIRLSWENPLIAVDFPDGYQFVVFENEKDFIDQKEIASAIIDQLYTHREHFEEEYNTIAQSTPSFFQHPRVLRSVSGQDKDPDIDNRELTFDEFARVKAMHLTKKALNEMHSMVIKNGFNNDDLDDYAFRIQADEEQGFLLEVVGFDFEYYREIKPEWIVDRLERAKKFRSESATLSGLSIFTWDDGADVTIHEHAAYYAMLEKEGILFENKDRRK